MLTQERNREWDRKGKGLEDVESFTKVIGKSTCSVFGSKEGKGVGDVTQVVVQENRDGGFM